MAFVVVVPVDDDVFAELGWRPPLSFTNSYSVSLEMRDVCKCASERR